MNGGIGTDFNDGLKTTQFVVNMNDFQDGTGLDRIGLDWIELT